VELPEPGLLRASIECSSGTYIRVLADDLGRLLGGGAHARNLRRTAVGPWQESAAVPLDHVTEDRVHPPVAALPWLEAVTVQGDAEQAVRYGRPLSKEEIGATGDGPWRVLAPAGDLLAIYEPTRRIVLV
jgi:tRNA pseudouridine55 synthase